MDIYESLSKVGKNLMLKEAFYGLFLLQLNKKVSKDIPTAGVCKNGINFDLLVGEDFWNQCTDDQRLGLLKHELLHIVFMHLLIQDEFPDKALFNIAADLEINQYIDPQYYPSPDLMLLSTFPELNLPKNAGTREYYKLLQKDLGTGKSPTLDNIHSQLSQSDGGSYKNMKHMDWEKLTEGLSEAEKKLLKKQIDHQIKDIVENSIKNRGTVPSELKQYIDGLFVIEPPVIDWASYVRRFIGNSDKIYTKKTRRKLNKRFSENPALKIKSKKHIGVAIDTSGSVSDLDLIEFFNEIHHIHKTGVKISIIECDAAIHRIYEYKGLKEDKISVKGRGGTAFQPVIDYVNNNPRLYTSLVYLTDMECPAPTKCCKPTLWVACSTSSSDMSRYDDFHGVKIQIKR